MHSFLQGYTVRNLSLAGVSKITGLDRLEVRGLFISVPSPEGAVVGGRRTENIAVGPSAIAILTSEGELSSVSEAFSIDPGTGTLSTPRIGPHEVTGDVDFVGNAVRQAVLESPDIRRANNCCRFGTRRTRGLLPCEYAGEKFYII